jgi:hypothetical protein
MYLGNQPALSYTSFAKQDFTTSATTSYTLDNPIANANELALFINFVRQEPTTAYTASGTSLTLTSATSATDDMYCVYLGKAVQTVNPPAGSVGTSQLADASVTPAKLNLNDNLLFNTSSKGIYLGVTSATASNLLDDYEEGTWTPVINSGTCTILTAKYTKIGNQCMLHFRLTNFSDSSSATDIQITGMPFAQPSNTEDGVGSAYGERTDVNKPTVCMNSNIIRFRNGFGVSTFDTPLQYSDINDGADFDVIASVTYETA